jgi:hypothetical protein
MKTNYKVERRYKEMKNKNLFGVVSLAVVALLMVSVVSAYYVASFNEGKREIHENLNEALDNNNYDAWREIMISTLTRENFDRQVEARKNSEQHQQIMEELRQAWVAGDSERIAELRKQLEATSDGKFVMRIGSSDETLSRKAIISRDEIEQGKKLFGPDGEELEVSQIDRQGKKLFRSNGEESEEGKMQKRIIRSSDGIQKRSFWDAFRFW